MKPKWNYTKSVPQRIYVACSGGVDSVAAAAILSEWRDVTLVHYHHGEHAGNQEQEIVAKLAHKLHVPVIFNHYTGPDVLNNREAQWRKARYTWFHELDAPVVTAHTLNDATEWYLITCLRGEGHFMEYSNQNCIRPFLLTPKQELVDYCTTMNLEWFQDPTNDDNDFALRNKVRNRLMPVALECEPGLTNMVKRRIIEKIRNQS